MRRAGCAAAGLVLAALTSGAQAAPGDGRLDLPEPVGTIPVPAPVFTDRPERLRTSSVPGRVDDEERVSVGIGPDGTPARVLVEQRLRLTGTGDFVIRERATATSVEALEDTTAPVLQRSAVVWQGFVPGERELAARITLDPVVEAPRLPLGVAIDVRRAGQPAVLAADGTLQPGDEVTVRLVNQTRRPGSVETGTAPAAALAAALDALRSAASANTSAPPPMAGRELPAQLAGSAETGVRAVETVAPLRVTGTITVAGGAATVTGPATTPVAGGAALSGVLSTSVEFAVRAPEGGRLVLDLTVVPVLDPRPLAPPYGGTWAGWAARDPSPADRATAATTLVDAALAAARTDEYQPYLGHHGPGSVRTSFHYALVPPEQVAAPRPPLRPRPVPIALTLAGLVAVAGGAVTAWRRA